MMVRMLLIVLGLGGAWASPVHGQAPYLLNEFPLPTTLTRFYQARGVQQYTLQNYRLHQGDTLSRGIYKTVSFDPYGRPLADSTGTAMGRRYDYVYDEEAGRLNYIRKRTAKGEGWFIFVYDSLNRPLHRVEISHRQDTNEVQTFRYNEAGQLTERLAKNPATESLTTYTYDAEGRLVEQSTLTQTIKGEIQTGERYLFNAKGQQIGIRGIKDGIVRQVDDYRYNELGQVSLRILPGKGEEYRYQYDGQGLLLRVEVYDQRSRKLKGFQQYRYTFF